MQLRGELTQQIQNARGFYSTLESILFCRTNQNTRIKHMMNCTNSCLASSKDYSICDEERLFGALGSSPACGQVFVQPYNISVKEKAWRQGKLVFYR